ANSSFVHQIVDKTVSAGEIARDPFETVARQGPAANPAIPRPADIFAGERENSRGWDHTDPVTLAAIEEGRAGFAAPFRWKAVPVSGGKPGKGEARQVVNPAVPSEIVGEVVETDAAEVARAVEAAGRAAGGWAARPVA